MKKKISISDIAKELSVSITTISFILNGKAKAYRISDNLVTRVTEYIQEVGYKPSKLAQSLRTGKTKIIGLMVEDISNPFFATIARLIEEKAYRSGYKILYCSTDNNTDKAKELIGMFVDRHVDGYIITPSTGIEHDILSLIESEWPVVLFDRFFSDLDTDYVVIDNAEGAYNAVLHLIKQGYRNIGFVTLESQQSQMKNRLIGYQRALKEFNIKPRIKTISFNAVNEFSVREIASFLSFGSPIDAVFFGTNYLAISGLEAIKQLGLHIPNDLAVIAFDDHDLFRLYSPGISAIAQPVEEIAEQLIQILLEQLRAGVSKTRKQTIVLPTTLIIRDSSCSSKKS
ncbi:MAG: LacI family DNA-binding transcriptional regulator [Sphingobacteriaceae bacterium]